MSAGHDAVVQLGSAAAAAATAAVGLSLSGLSLEWLGVPMPVLLFGMSGSLCALSFLAPMARPKMATAVVIGTLAAAASTPIAAHLFDLPRSLHLGVAFFSGLFAHLMMTWAFRKLPDIIEAKLGGRRRGGD